MWLFKSTRRVATHVGAPLAIAMLALGACADAHPTEQDAPTSALVIVVDRTGVAQQESWAVEVGSQTRARVERALAEGVDRVDVTGVGSNSAQTATAATVDLDSIDGNTEAKRRQREEQVVGQVATVASQLAAQPVETDGTDVVVALRQAADLCAAPGLGSCAILLLSDLEDSRLLTAASTDAAVAELRPQMPSLTGVVVEASGLGATGSNAATVTRVEDAWTRLLTHAGAVDIRMARSL